MIDSIATPNSVGGALDMCLTCLAMLGFFAALLRLQKPYHAIEECSLASAVNCKPLKTYIKPFSPLSLFLHSPSLAASKIPAPYPGLYVPKARVA